MNNFFNFFRKKRTESAICSEVINKENCSKCGHKLHKKLYNV
jgi:hypothetical protein